MPVRSISSNGPMRKPQESRITASTWLGAGAALLVDAQALGADRRAAEIDQEARRVAHHHRHAGLALAQRHHGVDHPLRGVGGADHLDQLHQRHGIEIVHAADAVAVLQRARDRGDADRRGVGGEDRIGRDHGLELAEQLLLHLEILEHRLDHDVAALEVRRACRRRRDWRRSWRRRRRSGGPWRPGPSGSRGWRPSPWQRRRPAASNRIALMPPCAVTCAMPRPMAPVPTTPTMRSGRLMSRVIRFSICVVLSAAKDLGLDRHSLRREILRCAQDDNLA